MCCSTASITFTPVKDAYVAEYYPCTNFGHSPYLFTNRFQGYGDIYRTYIKFDLCSLLCNKIPPNSCIRHACLWFPIYRNEVPVSDNTLYVFRVIQNWTEKAITWNNQPITALIPDGSTLVTPNDQYVNIDVTHLVNWWYNGLYPDFGLQLRCDENFDSLLAFFSREYPNSDYWPRLTVWYTDNFHSSCDCDCDCGCNSNCGCNSDCGYDCNYGCGCNSNCGCGCNFDYGCNRNYGYDCNYGCGCNNNLGCGCNCPTCVAP